MTPNDLDNTLRLVADSNRREIISQLRQSPDNTTKYEDLINRLYDESGTTERAEIAIALEHTHLPMLADHDLIEYDRRSGAVRYQPDRRVEAVLDAVPDELPPASV